MVGWNGWCEGLCVVLCINVDIVVLPEKTLLMLLGQQTHTALFRKHSQSPQASLSRDYRYGQIACDQHTQPIIPKRCFHKCT